MQKVEFEEATTNLSLIKVNKKGENKMYRWLIIIFFVLVLITSCFILWKTLKVPTETSYFELNQSVRNKLPFSVNYLYFQYELNKELLPKKP